MNNPQLNHLLKSASVPEREPEYWDDFPQSVTRRLRSGIRSPAPRRIRSRYSPLLLWSFGLATACVVMAFAIGFRRGHESGLSASRVAAMQKYFLEVEALFPNQVRAIIIDERGPRLVLSEKPDVPASPPLMFRISGQSGSQSVVTFSGQQIAVNGDVCDVLTDAEGQVLLVGQTFIWSSGQRGSGQVPYRIAARALENSL